MKNWLTTDKKKFVKLLQKLLQSGNERVIKYIINKEVDRKVKGSK